MKIGFVGLGNVGGKLANSLIRNKFDLTVRDLDENLTKPFLKLGANEKELMGKNARLYFEKEFDREKQTNSIINIVIPVPQLNFIVSKLLIWS